MSAQPEARAGRGRFYAAMAVVALLVAAVLALFASAEPDGLERVAIDTGFADSAQDSAVADSPLADYTLGGAAAEPSPARSATAGVAGVALMAAVAFGVFGLLGRRSSPPEGSPPDGSAPHCATPAPSTTDQR